MKTLNIFLVVVILGSFIACDEDVYLFDNDNRVTGRGDIETDKVFVNEFSSIDLENVSNVYVLTGKEQTVTFTAYENILPYMEADVVGDELVLRFNRNINVNSDEEIRVDITIPELEKVTLSGVGNFYLTGPTQESIGLELNGVGNIEAFELPVYAAGIELNGTGNIEVRAKDLLEVDIDGLGNVYYQGDPEIVSDINGLGEIISEQ
jgi:hypothetical protein